jgi:hypothetical protein
VRSRALAALAAAAAAALAVAAPGPLAAGEDAPGPYAPGPYAEPVRTAHLQRALDALRALGDAGGQALDRELHAAVRARCRPTGSRPPATSCMALAARGICDRRPDPAGCAAAADIVLTNQHAEPDLLDEATRLRLVRTSADYHAAVLGELRARSALLAAELALAAPQADAAAIDRFCVERDRAGSACDPRAALCVPSLPWQRCAAALIWFVSTSRGASP